VSSYPLFSIALPTVDADKRCDRAGNQDRYCRTCVRSKMSSLREGFEPNPNFKLF